MRKQPIDNKSDGEHIDFSSRKLGSCRFRSFDSSLSRRRLIDACLQLAPHRHQSPVAAGVGEPPRAKSGSV